MNAHTAADHSVASDPSNYSAAFLQALNDWQISSTADRAIALINAVEALPDATQQRIRHATAPLFRRIDLTNGALHYLGEHFELPEKVSSWTTSIDVAKQFRQGVAPKALGVTGIVVRLESLEEEVDVVVNVSACWADSAFHDAIARHRATLRRVARGIDKYKNDQYEIVAQVRRIPIDSVCAFGGFSHLAPAIRSQMAAGSIGVKYAKRESLAKFDAGVAEHPELFAPHWLEGAEAVARVRKVLPIFARVIRGRRA